MSKKTYAVLRTAEGRRYGTVLSRHRTRSAAADRYKKECQAVLRRYPMAIISLMFEIVEFPTPAGDSGKVGESVAIDLSRNS